MFLAAVWTLNHLDIESYKSPVEGIFFFWCNLSYPIFLVFTVYILSIWQRNRLCALALCVADVVTLPCVWCWLASEVSVWEEMVALQGFAAALRPSLWAALGPHPLVLFMTGSAHGSKHTVWLPANTLGVRGCRWNWVFCGPLVSCIW